MGVYLDGDRICHLDWSIETSRQFIRREYFFENAIPKLAVETIHAKLDADAERLAEPRLLSVERYRVDVECLTKRQKELMDHIRFLIKDFQKNRKKFRCVAN